MNIVVAESLGKLDPGRWNGVATGCVAGRYELVEEFDAEEFDAQAPGGRSRRYYAIADGDAYRCIARVSFVSVGRGTAALQSMLFGRAARGLAYLRLNLGDAAVCGWRLGRAGNVLADASVCEAERTELMHTMCRTIESEAAGRTLVFPDVLEDDGVLGDVLRKRGYAVAGALPVAFLDVTWRSLEEYLEKLKRTNKKWAAAARNEINRYRRSGAVTERLADGPGDHERVCELLNGHHERLNGQAPGYRPSLLRRLRCGLGNDFVAYVSRHGEGGPIVGACIGMKHGRDAVTPWIGIDHGASGTNFTYFNLAYYTPAAEYPGYGVERICLGNAAYDAKIKRGCRIVASKTYVRAPDAVRRTLQRRILAVQRAWYRRKFGRFVTAARP